MAQHPPWNDIITECITTTPDGTRHGVSRPAIKKFVDTKYHLSMNAATTSQLNRAIAYGTDSGNFTFPKGPSGKIKLAPKRMAEMAKEHKKPPTKRAKKVPVSTNEPPFTDEQQSMRVTRTYASISKKTRATAPGRKLPPRKAATRRGEAISAHTRSATRTGT